MNAFDVNFELLHSGVASLPGKLVIWMILLLEVGKICDLKFCCCSLCSNNSCFFYNKCITFANL